ncbi:Hypothetical predicted protein [Mytilus galloprovincialis]|uniref:Uncharacterized protein n=1 Tax=Mytilus galloprovincialis TaxID=29158 RepID=A0A8B6BHI8_MYTGA|nr:Hypothetical predicted protein [Mytilus galloprovincialis]
MMNTHTFKTSLGTNSQIACINDCAIAVTDPLYNNIHIVTIITPTGTTDFGIPTGTGMTGGITCRMNILYVAFSDAIRLMDLTGQIQRVINIPSVNELHSVNNDQMLCVYSQDAEKTMACLDLTNDKVHGFERFPFHPKEVTTDDVGNIIFIAEGVIWQVTSDGKNFKILITPNNNNLYTRLTYLKNSKVLVTFQEDKVDTRDIKVKLYRKQE